MSIVWGIFRTHWQAALAAALAVAVLVLQLQLDAARAGHLAYVASVEAVAAKAAQEKAEVEQRQAENLRTIEDKHDEKHVEAVRTGAVASIRRGLRKPASGGGGMPGIAASQPAHDDAGKECAAAYAIVADAAEDADTLTMWQEWARINHIPVRP